MTKIKSKSPPVPLELSNVLKKRIEHMGFSGSLPDGFIHYLNENIGTLRRERIIDNVVIGITKKSGQIERGEFSESIIKNVIYKFRGKIKLIKALLVAVFGDQWKEVYLKYYNENDEPKNTPFKIEECFENKPMEYNFPLKELNGHAELKNNYVSGIEDKYPDGLIKITPKYWEEYKLADKSEIINELKYFYINPAFSGGNIVQKVIANSFYTLPDDNISIKELSPANQPHKNINMILSELRVKRNFKCLIKITGFGGCGKTTYLWHLAKQYYEDFETYYLDSFDPDFLKLMPRSAPLLLMVDSFYEKNERYEILNCFFQKLDRFQRVIIVISERSDWFDYSERNYFNISSYFPYIYEIEFINTCINRNEVFDRILKLLKENDPDFSITDYEKEKLEAMLLDDKLSLVEAKYLLFCQLKANHKFCKHFRFDWEDWMEYIDSNSKYSDLKYLYHFIALFQQYGQKIPNKLNFNTIFNCNSIDFITVNESIGKFSTDNSPILIDEKFLSIRHDKLGELLIKSLNIQEKNIINKYIENYFNSISDAESIYLFRNIHRKNEAFKASPLFNKYLIIEKRIKIIADYLDSVQSNDYTDNECKCLTELIKSYEEISDKKEMLENINKLVQIEERLGYYHGKHMLANYYIKNEPSKYAEAEKLLKQIEQNIGLIPIIEYSFLKLYRKYNIKIPDYYKAILKKEAEDI